MLVKQSSFRHLTTTWLLAALAGLASSALADNVEYVATGTITAVVDGVEWTSHAYALVTEEEDGTVSELPGATYHRFDELVVGGEVLVPAHHMVSILTYNMALPRPYTGSWELSFPLVLETFELGDPEEIRLSFRPDGDDLSINYMLTEGELALERVEVVDASTLRISGSIKGLVTRQESYYPEHNPDDALAVDATFDFQKVVDYDAW